VSKVVLAPEAVDDLAAAIEYVNQKARRRSVRATASAKLFRNCDPSGSRSNLRLAVPVEVAALRAA
jgi:hypothetical protein